MNSDRIQPEATPRDGDADARAALREVRELMHDIRNHLNGMLGLVGVLLLQSGHPAAVRLRPLIGTQAQQLLNLIDSLSAGVLGPPRASSRSRFVPALFVPALVDLYRPYAAEHGVRLSHVVDAATPALPIDTSALHRLLSNLLVNAIKHAQASKVTLSAQPLAAGAGVQLMVADDGAGIAAQALSSLQAMLDGRRSAVEYDRSGLAICAGLATTLGATLSLRSTPGEGTLVTVHLRPAAAARPEAG
jgi:signal transduction histidine kinase